MAKEGFTDGDEELRFLPLRAASLLNWADRYVFFVRAAANAAWQAMPTQSRTCGSSKFHVSARLYRIIDLQQS